MFDVGPALKGAAAPVEAIMVLLAAAESLEVCEESELVLGRLLDRLVRKLLEFDERSVKVSLSLSFQ